MEIRLDSARVLRAMKRQRLTPYALAEAAGISVGSLQSALRGTPVSRPVAQMLASALLATVDDLSGVPAALAAMSLPDEKRDKIKALYSAGVPFEEIKKECVVTSATVARALIHTSRIIGRASAGMPLETEPRRPRRLVSNRLREHFVERCRYERLQNGRRKGSVHGSAVTCCSRIPLGVVPAVWRQKAESTSRHERWLAWSIAITTCSTVISLLASWGVSASVVAFASSILAVTNTVWNPKESAARTEAAARRKN